MTTPIDEADIWARLTRIFREAFLRDDLELTPGLTARLVPGWDSIQHIEILIAVQVEFGIKFNSREIEQLASVGDLVRVVASKLPQAQ